MEEQPDDQYEESEKEEPEPPKEEKPLVCKPVKADLKEKVQCACGRWMSQHTYKYQHKCKAQTVDEASAPTPEVQPEASEVLPPAKRRKRAVQEKLPPPEKPIKQKSVIKKQARIEQHAHASAARAPTELAHPLDVNQPVQQPIDIRKERIGIFMAHVLP